MVTADKSPKLCFSTLGCPDWSWREILQWGPDWGYAGVEIRLLERDVDLLQRPEFQPSNLSQRVAELHRANFRVAGLGSSVRFDDPDANERQTQVEIGKRYVDLAQHLQAEFVRVFGDTFTLGQDPASRNQVIHQIVAGLESLGEYAGPRGVSVVIETHGDFAQTQWMQHVLECVSNPAVGVLWDTHHPWRFYGEPLEESCSRLLPWIRHTHWKDSVAKRIDTISQDEKEAEAQARSLMSGHRPAHYVLFGEGEFPAQDALRLLKDAGYDGWYSLEWEKAWHPELAGPELALRAFPEKWAALKQSLENVL